MSISTVQIERILGAVAHRLYAGGVDPTWNEVARRVSAYFSQYPVGLPLPFPLDTVVSGEVSDVGSFNLILAHLRTNLDVLYETCVEQVNEIMTLSTSLQTDLQRLAARRQRVETRIDDFLLSLYNTDGYYYSISDVFSDLTLIDLPMTNAFVDTNLNQVVLPSIASLTRTVPASMIGTPAITTVLMHAGAPDQSVRYTTISPFSFSTDGTTNTVWEIQVVTDAPATVVATVTIPLGDTSNQVVLSRVDVEPYGVTPIQVLAEAGAIDANGVTTAVPFGNSIQTSLKPLSFSSNSGAVSFFRFTLRKTQYDYIDQTSGTTHYHYVFGAKSLIFTEQVYDTTATFVSKGLTIASDLTNDMVIDAVSLTTVDEIPIDTKLLYYVANDPGPSATKLSDFNWRAIRPVGSQGSNSSVIRFDGAEMFDQLITEDPGPSDLSLTPLNVSNPDPSLRNPNPNIIPGVDTYVLTDFTDTPLPNSLTLIEGYNSTRIHSTNYRFDAVDDLRFWSQAITAPSGADVPRKVPAPQVNYGRVDTGHGFFYGGDLGRSGISVYTETYLSVPTAIAPLSAYINKMDTNAQTWTVRAYLNGHEIGYLPGRSSDRSAETPLDSVLASWDFIPGLNHIAVAINIPDASLTSGIANPYIGTLDLMQNHNFWDFGTVKLADWGYVNFFDLQYNVVGSPLSFTIYNGQIISRRQPTTNFRLGYRKDTNTGPAGIRVRADLSRSIQNANVTPKLHSYRLRFSYGAVDSTGALV